jgi:glycerophosphoryl diester phosphodiesterase
MDPTTHGLRITSVLLTMMMLQSVFGDSPQPALKAITQPRVLVIAHRGASADFPENTIPAFLGALEVGADLVELDYYHARDQVPVVFHDKTLDRTTDALQRLGREKIPIDSLTLHQLRQLDAGAWFSDRFAGTRIPTLRESLSAIQGKSITLIERKAGDAATCVRLLRELNLVEEVVVQSFDWQYLEGCHEQDQRLVLGALGDKELTAERLSEAAAAGARVVGWNHEDLDAAAIKRAHDRGLRIWAYTVDEEPKARQLIADGIDGLITNRPKWLRTLIEQITEATTE